MTTPHHPQPSSATPTPAARSRRINLEWFMPSRRSSPIRSGSPSDSTSDGVAADTAAAWLSALLERAQMGAAANGAFTPAKDVFQSVVLLLEDVKVKMGDNQEVLKDICEKILSTLQTLQHVIQAHPNDASTAQLREKCQDFQQLLVGLSGKVEEIKKAKSGGHLRFKAFVLPSSIARAIVSYEKCIEDLQEELKLLAIADTNPTLNTAHAQITQTHEVAVLPADGPRWFADTFNPELARSHIEGALAGSISDIIQAIWDNLTSPICARLTNTANPLDKVQILFGHLDAQFGHTVLVHSFQEAVLKLGGIDYMLNHRLQESRTSHNLLSRRALDPEHSILQQRPVQDEIQTTRSCPLPSKFFQGRKDILLQLDRFFQPIEKKEQKVVLLHGLGGAGKTQIALKFIAESGARFTDQFKINASSAETIEVGYKQIAMAKKLGDTAEAAQTWLKAHHAEWLLLFDNADQPNLDLEAYLPQCNHGNILITSRNPGLWVHTGSPQKAITVSNLLPDDAVLLLLNRAGVELLSNENKIHAVQIVQELYCFPLAIIQAGAFISKSSPLRQDISKYIPLYQGNKATLLSRKPEQSHGDYQWTVYTTWQISFDQLGPQAAQFLQLCSFIHFEGITEDIFQRASEYTPGNEPLDPSLDTLQTALDFLSNFRNAESNWNSLKFAEMMSEICDYSLMTWQENAYLIHPLVHQWAGMTITNQIEQRKMIVALLGMATARSTEIMQKMQLLLHVMRLSEDGDIQGTGFEGPFGDVFQEGGMFRRAETLRSDILIRSDACLGREHPKTLVAMAKLAGTFWSLGQYTEAQKLEEQVLEKRSKLLGAEHPNTIDAIARLARTFRSLGQYTEAQKLEELVLEKRTKLLGAEHPNTIDATARLAVTFWSLGRYTKAQKLQEAVLEKRTKLLGAEHPNTIDATASLAVTFWSLGRYTEAWELQEAVLEKQTKLLGAKHPNTIDATANLAAMFWSLGQYTEAQKLQEEVLEKQTKLLGAEHPNTIDAIARLARTFRSLGQYTEAQKLEELVLEKRTKLLGAEHPKTIDATSRLAVTFWSLGRYTEAQKLQELVLEKRTKLLGANHPNTIEATASLAATFWSMGRYTEAQELQEEVLEKWTKLLGAKDPNTINATASLGVTFWSLGQYTEAQKLQEEVLEKQSKLLGAEHPDTIDTIARLAAMFWSLGQYTEAQKLEDEVLEKRTKLLGAEHPDTIDATARLAVTFQSLGRYTEAQKLQEQVLEKRNELLGAEHPKTIDTTASLAVMFWSLGQYTEAQKLQELVLEKRTKLLGADHPNTIEATDSLAVTFWSMGRYTEAQELQEEVLEKWTKLLGAKDPNTIDATASLAAMFWSLGRYTEAQKLQEQVLEKRSELLGAEHPNTIDATASLAVTFWSLGQYTEAQKLQEEVLEKQTKLLGAEHPKTIDTTASLAAVFWSLGQYTEAQKLQEQVLEKRSELLGAEHPDTIDATGSLAVTFWSLGQYTEAQKLQEEVLEKQTKLLGAEHPKTIDTTARLAAVFWSLGQYTEAQKLQEQVLEKRSELLGAEHPNTIDATASLAVMFWSLGQYTEAQKLQEEVLEKRTKLLGAEHPNTILATANLAETLSCMENGLHEEGKLRVQIVHILKEGRSPEVTE
ncbi:hypothetical protein C8F01DRAFT_1231699 [Mycena amicta]|nr:hypothetical protein C8F01DRAFT_1231699 [Mycena amicta]